jgi:molybdopterin-guanine dinucleotide biosynthesis protein A
MTKIMIKGVGIILGGGRSSRIGQEKCLLKLNDRPVFEIVLSKLKPLVKEIILVTNTPQLFDEDNKFKIVTDEIPYQGPLGGILAGLSSSSEKYNLVVACDMPFLNTDLIDFLFNEISDEDVIIPCSEKGIEPLHAIYSKDCLPVIRRKLESGKKRVISFFDEVKIKYIDKEKIKEFDPKYLSFFNINTPEDWELAQKISKSLKENK